jgi:hypothetical protein
MLQQRIDRPEKAGHDRPEGDFKYGGISYYWQNNRYYVFVKEEWYDKPNSKFVNEEREVVLFDVENIFDFRRFRNWSAIIFDTNTSFYSVKQHIYNTFGLEQHTLSENEPAPKISQRQVIKNTSDYFLWYPFQVESLGGEKVSILLTTSNWDKTDRILLYLADEDRLIQDLDELIGK